MFKTILVALDGSELSDSVIQALQQLSLQPERVVIAHVIVNAGSNPDIAVDRPQAEVELLPHHQVEKLQAYQASLSCQSELEIVTGDPSEEILRLSNIHHVDLIVIGSRGLTGVNRILMRSVSSQVVEEATCSVLVVKPSS